MSKSVGSIIKEHFAPVVEGHGGWDLGNGLGVHMRANFYPGSSVKTMGVATVNVSPYLMYYGKKVYDIPKRYTSVIVHVEDTAENIIKKCYEECISECIKKINTLAVKKTLRSNPQIAVMLLRAYARIYRFDSLHASLISEFLLPRENTPISATEFDQLSKMLSVIYTDTEGSILISEGIRFQEFFVTDDGRYTLKKSGVLVERHRLLLGLKS